MSKSVLVTGGSRGIGAAISRLLAKQGWMVCINYHNNRSAADDLCDDIQSAGGHAVTVQGDIGQEEDVLNLFAAVDDLASPFGALVNNAGIIAPQARLQEMNSDRVLGLLRTNVLGALLCCREAVKRLSTGMGGTGGGIVNVSSVAARTGSPNEYIDYAASKGALDTLTIGLAHEVAAEGIRVNGVRPGFIYTDMHKDAGEPGRVDRLAPNIPMRRGGDATEVANAVAWLLSAESSYTTGSFIEVAGGR